jgi:hypothetical protein
MFPERIDKMVLDGVQNPYQYYRSPAYVSFANRAGNSIY